MINMLEPAAGDHRQKDQSPFSRAKATILRFGRNVPILVGAWRFFKILLGRGAPTSQEVAANWLMLIGFAIEGFILRQVVIDQATHDIGSSPLPLLDFLFFLVPVVILALLFHQFAIFRNFALPRERTQEAYRTGIDKTIGEAIRSLEQQDATSALANLQDRPHSREDPATRRKYIEVMLYLLFGVLTGEAGYMLTLLHEHNPNHVSAEFVWRLFGTQGMSWGRSLECVFLTCAMGICLGVLLWDLAVLFSEGARKQYGGLLLMQFFINDFLSLCFWGCLLAVVTPSVRWLLGVHFDPSDPSKQLLGWGGWAWLFLMCFSGLYLLAMALRFCLGLLKLGREPSYTDARFKEI